MKRFLGVTALTGVLLVGGTMITLSSAQAESPLTIVYPPSQHETSAEKIFFIGTGSPDLPVLINNQEVDNRSASGHFAPSLPLNMGENIFVIRQADKKIRLNITRVSNQPEIPQDFGFAPDSLTPAVDIARMPDEPVCLSAIAPPNAKVSAQIGSSKILLMPQISSVELPANSAVLTSEAIAKNKSGISHYKGCTVLNIPRSYGKPVFTLEQDERQITQSGQGAITVLSPKDFRVVEVIADAGVARTGASTNFS
ncbi:MAG: N-acetylmuramoyl-L-alanine amidase, partial [Cyanobacteria bacterium P01_C01_bin.72]